MKLYFIPFACSLATRIAIEEAELDAEFEQVTRGGTLADGRAFATVSPMGYVPALEMRDGTTLTEGPAVLEYLADLAAEDVLAPAPYTSQRYAMRAWLNFISTELHKAVFHPLMVKDANDGARAYALTQAQAPFDRLAAHLADREFLLDRFSVADAYLLAVLNWCGVAGVPIERWPRLVAWRDALRRRPSVARASAAEMPLLKAA